MKKRGYEYGTIINNEGSMEGVSFWDRLFWIITGRWPNKYYSQSRRGDK